MTGKASLILVIGFTLIFLVMGYLWESVSTRSVDNHVSYYKNSIAYNIAVSGANIALSEVLRDSTWESDIIDVPFENGIMNVEISELGPPTRILKSTGTFMGAKQIVRIKLSRGQKAFALYAWFNPSVVPAGLRPWVTGDHVYGGVHSNAQLNVDGNPVFHGKVTTFKGIKDQAVNPLVSNPQFLGGHEEGVQVSWNAEMNYPDHAALAAEGESLGGNCNFNGQNVWLKFHDNGNVTYRVDTKNSGDDTSKYSAPVTRSLSALAPTGVIYVNKANVYVSGKLNGHVSIACEGGAGTGQGNVLLVDDMVYNTTPMIENGAGGYMINPESVYEDGTMKDYMEIFATNYVKVATSALSGGYQNNVVEQDINIHAAIFCTKGGFAIEDINAIPYAGTIYLQGAMTAGVEEKLALLATGSFVIEHGYNRHVVYDSRLSKNAPIWTYFVYYYKVVSWLEGIYDF